MNPDSALRTTLARIARLGDHYELAIAPDGEGWMPADELVAGGWPFDEIVERLGGGHGPAARRAIGSQLVLLYLRFVWPAVAAFALERRVPDVAAANLLVRLDDEGWPAAFALREPRMAVLAEDPAGGEASVVTDDPAALMVWLQERAI